MPSTSAASPPDAQITFIQVTDLERSHAFYTDIMGFVLVTDQGACRIYRVAEGAYIGICNHAGPPSPDAIMLTVVRADVEQWCASAAEAGAEFDKAPTYNERFGITQAFLRDPDGYIVEVQRFDDLDWARPLR